MPKWQRVGVGCGGGARHLLRHGAKKYSAMALNRFLTHRHPTQISQLSAQTHKKMVECKTEDKFLPMSFTVKITLRKMVVRLKSSLSTYSFKFLRIIQILRLMSSPTCPPQL